MTDNRSTFEKLSDINQLKINLQKNLYKLLDGTQYQIAINQMSDHEIIFASQQSFYIIKELTPKYSIGMLGSEFVNYIRRLKEEDESTNVDNTSIQIISYINKLKEQISKLKNKIIDDTFENIDIQEDELKIFEKDEDKTNIIEIELDRDRVGNNLFNWFKKYNYVSVENFVGGYRICPPDHEYLKNTFVKQSLVQIEESLKRYYNKEIIDNYILDLQKILELKIIGTIDERYYLFKNAYLSWYSCHKVAFGNSFWDTVLENHFIQHVPEDRFLRNDHIIQLNEFIKCIIDILNVLKSNIY